jgi:hypothetical protein
VRRFLTWLSLAAILAGGAYLGSPYYAVYRLVQAARAGDGRTVAGYVDFPAVRASLKPQLQGYLDAEIAHEKAKPHSLWDRLGLALAPFLVGPSTDLLITPDTVAAMIRTGRPPKVTNPLGPKPKVSTEGGPGDARALDYGYVGDDLDQFHAQVASRAHPSARVNLRLLRRGFFAWKVVSLDLPSLPGSARAAAPAA